MTCIILGSPQTITFNQLQGAVGTTVSYTQLLKQALPDLVIGGSPSEPIKAVYEIPQSTNTVIASDISTDESDNSFNTTGDYDSGNADFSIFDKGDWIGVSGFTRHEQNTRTYQISKTVSPTATKILLEGESLLVKEYAGASVTIAVVNTGRLSTGNFGVTASIWIPTLNKWIAKGTKTNVNAALASLSFLPQNQAGDLQIDGRVTDSNGTIIESDTYFMEGSKISLPITNFTLSDTQLVTNDFVLGTNVEIIVTFDNSSKTNSATVSLVRISTGDVITNGSVGSFLIGEFGGSLSSFSNGILSFFGENDEVDAFLGNLQYVPVSSYSSPFQICIAIKANNEQETRCIKVIVKSLGTPETIVYCGQPGEVIVQVEGGTAAITFNEQPGEVQVVVEGNNETITYSQQPGEVTVTVLGSPQTITYDGLTGISGEVVLGSPQTIIYNGQLGLDPSAIGNPQTITYTGQLGVGAEKFKVIAVAKVGSAEAGTIATTTDPTGSWFVDVNIPGTSSHYAVASDGSGITVISPFKVYVSDETPTLWDEISPGLTSSKYAIGYDGTTWVRGGGSGDISTATDPRGTWVARQPSGFGTKNIYAICNDGTTWLIAGEDSELATTTTPASNSWTARANPMFYDSYGAATDGTNWVVVGGLTTARIMVASDPTSTWTLEEITNPSPSIDTHFNAVAFDGTTWVVVGGKGVLYTATDPTGTWTLRASSFGGLEHIYAVAYDSINSIWIIGGDAGKIATATDPTSTWTQRTSNISSDHSIRGIATTDLL